MKTTELPKTPAELEKMADKLRGELRELELARSLQKLDSPAKLRYVRRDLARVLTMKNIREKEATHASGS